MAEQESFISRMALAYGDEQNAALTFAFYNTLLFTLLGISLASIFAVYQMLYMFLHPILWAALVGTVLFPLKRMISANLGAWLGQLDAQDRPLLVGLAILPVQTLMTFSNYIYKTTFSFTGICIGICYCLLKFFCYYDALATILKWIGNIYDRIDALIELFTMKWMFVGILLYTLGFGTWVYLQDLQQINKKFARVLSLPIWLLLLAHISNFIAPLRVLIFAFICSMLALISAGIMDPKNGNTEEGEEAKIEEKKEDEKMKEGSQNNKEDTADISTAILHSSSDDENRLDQALTSDTNLRIITSLCAILFVVNHNSLLLIFFIFPFTLALLVDIGERIGLTETIWNFLLSTKQLIVDKSSKFIHVIVAGPLRKFVHLIFTSDRIFINGLSARVDLISSICVMAALAIGTLFFALFTAFQLHNETVHLVKLGGNILSSNPDWFKYAMNYTEGHLAEHDLDNYMQQAYQQGRSWLASNIRSLADSKDQARADQLEEQAKLLVDNLYRFWEERGHRVFEEPIMAATADNALAKQQMMENDDFEMERGGNKKWFSRLLQDTNLGLWKREFRAFVQENLEMVWTIAQSLWHVLLMNINILSTILIAIVGFILGFGFELLNFLIECIVFLTTVYYLLANSTDQWLPLDRVNNFATSLQIHRLALAHEGHRVDVAKAIEQAISGVFLLTAKMSIFYGLYTYFIHSLFTLNVMFLPSMLAAILAAIPIFPPYAVSMFGIIELWLVRGEPIAAIFFALTSIAPLFFADPVFYREVKGSHPYITGLAVVGGIYWLGLQGAIIGPIILCLMIALLNLYAEFANHRPTSNNRT